MADLVGTWELAELAPGERVRRTHQPTRSWEKVTAEISKADERTLTMAVGLGTGDCFGICCIPRRS
tara:strand:+ start:1412 stop:1609 length:198 start_codon:yes stop_codon:yes gene_type:complete